MSGLRIDCCEGHSVGYMLYSLLLDSRTEVSRVLRHVKPSRCEEASRNSRAISWDRAQAIDQATISRLQYKLPERPTLDRDESFSFNFESNVVGQSTATDDSFIYVAITSIEIFDLPPQYYVGSTPKVKIDLIQEIESKFSSCHNFYYEEINVMNSPRQ